MAQQELALGEGAAAGGAREAQARPRARARVGVLPAQVAPQGAPSPSVAGEGLGAVRAGLREKRGQSYKIAYRGHQMFSKLLQRHLNTFWVIFDIFWNFSFFPVKKVKKGVFNAIFFQTRLL